MKQRGTRWHQALEAMLREAAMTLRFLPADNCRPAGYKSNMPTPKRDWWDRDHGYNSDGARRKAGRPVRAVSSGAISRLDYVLQIVASAPLTARHRAILWGRAEGKMWKEIAHKEGISERTARRQHSNALAELCAYVIARQRKAMSDFSLSALAAKVA